MRKLIWGLIIFFIAIFVAVFVIGPIWEQIERLRVAEAFPAPGRLVDVGERKIQIDCRGEGAPMVVFESGLGPSGATDWFKVHDEVAKFTRACAYSRAGIMWSDDKPGVHDGEGVARDLHAVLEAAGEKGPLVLVGHSIGGPYISIFTKLYSDRVAGLVYLDGSYPEQEKRFEAALGRSLKFPLLDASLKLAAFLSWTGVPRVGLMAFGSSLAEGLGDSQIEVLKALAPSSLAAMRAEADALPRTFAEASSARSLGARPFAVLTAGKPPSDKMLSVMGMTREEATKLENAWFEMQNEIASWSSRASHRTLGDSDHVVQFDRPDAVIEAVRSVVETVRVDDRSKGSLP
ncbi:MAG: alpha/beta hydrolase [Methylocystaceae bacterium]|nr:MAG: alpha/beta hydrolase [Methylocystaceae bacterium]